MWDDLCPSSIQRLRLLWQRGQWEVKVIPQQPGNSGCCVRILRYLGWHKSGGCSTSPDLPFPLSDLISLRVKRMWDLFSLLFFEVNFSVPLALAERHRFERAAHPDLCRCHIFLPAGICKQGFFPCLLLVRAWLSSLVTPLISAKSLCDRGDGTLQEWSHVCLASFLRSRAA